MSHIKTCCHLFDDDRRCGSPALRGENHCYFHHPTRRPIRTGDLQTRRERRGFQIVLPHDRRSLQLGLNQVIQRLASNQLDVHRASVLLYSLQQAGSNLAG